MYEEYQYIGVERQELERDSLQQALRWVWWVDAVSLYRVGLLERGSDQAAHRGEHIGRKDDPSQSYWLSGEYGGCVFHCPGHQEGAHSSVGERII